MDLTTDSDPYKVCHIKTLRKFRETDALEILESVAKQVQPIMSKHKWRVPILSEFCHPKTSLLGLNVEKGVEIKIRLRRPENELEFLPYNQILQTMLHELCHNDYRHHSSQFYQLLEIIKQECDELLVLEGMKASMQGLDINDVGSSCSTIEMGIESFSPNLLTAAGEMLGDDVWCELLSKSLGTDEGSSSSSSEEGSRASLSSLDNDVGSVVIPVVQHQSSEIPPTTRTIKTNKMWECNICTLLNQSQVASCEACGIPKEGDETADKYCKDVWSCKFCTLNNSMKVERCLLCGEWRYSYGPPASAFYSSST